MDRCVGAAARLPESDRKDLAILALARSETVSDLAARLGVSRKFVYQQTHKAVAALDDAFSLATPDDEVLFELAVTKAWLRQVIVGLTLICRSSYRGVVEFLRDLLGVPVSVGCIHDVLQAATREASAINHNQDLSSIRVGLHDEIFQGATPVLAGVDAASTYCYLLAAERRRDADTWGVHLLDAAEQGLRPDYTIADAGQGLRAGQRAAWGDTPCHGDVFHIQRQCEGFANTLSRLAKGATSRRKTLQAKMGRAGPRGPDRELATQLAPARQARARQIGLMIALGTRLVLLAAISWIIRLTAPVFAIAGQDFSWRDLILIGGGLFLLYKGTQEIHARIEGEHDAAGPARHASFGATILQIGLLDIVFSLDSVITAVGMANQLPIMIAAVVIAMGVMLVASGPVSAFVNRHPTVKMLALSFLLLIGMVLIADGFGAHVPKGYIYAAIGFSLMVELLNQLAGRRRRVPGA